MNAFSIFAQFAWFHGFDDRILPHWHVNHLYFFPGSPSTKDLCGRQRNHHASCETMLSDVCAPPPLMKIFGCCASWEPPCFTEKFRVFLQKQRVFRYFLPIFRSWAGENKFSLVNSFCNSGVPSRSLPDITLHLGRPQRSDSKKEWNSETSASTNENGEAYLS